MRSSLSIFPVRRVAVASLRRKGGSSHRKMLGKLEAASRRLASSRRGR